MAAKKPQNLSELKSFIALYTDFKYNENQKENIKILSKMAHSDKFVWDLTCENAYT